MTGVSLVASSARMAELSEQDLALLAGAVAQLERPGLAARLAGVVGMPVERSENFGNVVRRFLRRMRPERPRVIAVLVLAVVSVTLTVIGPRILGHATNIIVAGIQTPAGINFGDLNRVLLEAWRAHGLPVMRRSREQLHREQVPWGGDVDDQRVA